MNSRSATALARRMKRVADDVRAGGGPILFAGATGTGKRMAAESLARQLGVELLRIDLGAIVSKYIGDTEKNIDRIFAEAQRSGAALLFDEADALFGRRSDVRDAHDRYANIDINYLLQRIEEHPGIVLLTANRKANLDPAFLRRLRLVVDLAPKE